MDEPVWNGLKSAFFVTEAQKTNSWAPMLNGRGSWTYFVSNVNATEPIPILGQMRNILNLVLSLNLNWAARQNYY